MRSSCDNCCFIHKGCLLDCKHLTFGAFMREAHKLKSQEIEEQMYQELTDYIMTEFEKAVECGIERVCIGVDTYRRRGIKLFEYLQKDISFNQSFILKKVLEELDLYGYLAKFDNSQYIDLFLNESTMQEHLGDCDYKTILRGNNPNCITPNESKVWVNGKDNVSFFERVCGKRNG